MAKETPYESFYDTLDEGYRAVIEAHQREISRWCEQHFVELDHLEPITEQHTGVRCTVRMSAAGKLRGGSTLRWTPFEVTYPDSIQMLDERHSVTRSPNSIQICTIFEVAAEIVAGMEESDQKSDLDNPLAQLVNEVDDGAEVEIVDLGGVKQPNVQFDDKITVTSEEHDMKKALVEYRDVLLEMVDVDGGEWSEVLDEHEVGDEQRREQLQVFARSAQE